MLSRWDPDKNVKYETNLKQLILSSKTMNAETMIHLFLNTLREIFHPQPSLCGFTIAFVFIIFENWNYEEEKESQELFFGIRVLARGKSISRHEKINCWKLVTDYREQEDLCSTPSQVLLLCPRFISTAHRLDFHLIWMQLDLYLNNALHQTSSHKVPTVHKIIRLVLYLRDCVN